jgi:hypothetical protein
MGKDLQAKRRQGGAIELRIGGGSGCHLATEGCVFVLNGVRGKVSQFDQGFDIFCNESANYQSYHDRFLNVRQLAIYSGPNVTIHRTRFYGDTEFAEDWPKVAGEMSLNEVRVLAGEYTTPGIVEEAVVSHALESYEGSGVPVNESILTPEATAQEEETVRAYFPLSGGKGTYEARHTIAGEVRPKQERVRRQEFDLVASVMDPYDRYIRTYERCVLHVVNSTFNRCSALSDWMSVGGAILLIESQCLCQGTTLTESIAGLGGAIYALSSGLAVRETNFLKCQALFDGGAVLPSRSSTLTGSVFASENVAQFVNCTFWRCDARETAGGISLNEIADAAIDRSSFIECHGGVSGGAASVVSSNLLIFKSHFVNNTVGVAVLAGEGRKGSDLQHYIGGGIVFLYHNDTDPRHVYNDMISGDGAEFQLATEDTCFVGNRINGTNVEGFDIYLGGI